MVKEKRAERLKAARSFAGYGNRKDFCSQFNIPYDTLDAWERGKNPLTLKGAKRIVDVLKSAGVYCSEEWLMEGQGISPRPLEEVNSSITINFSDSLTLFEKNINLATEISTFTTLNKNSIVTIVKDEAMLPFYKKGDYVGGVRLKGDDLSKAINKRCIVEFLDGQITVRHLQKANTPFFYKVCALNKNVDEKLASEESFLEVASAAPILWHRTFP
jgi:hypothetical protein